MCTRRPAYRTFGLAVLSCPESLRSVLSHSTAQHAEGVLTAPARSAQGAPTAKQRSNGAVRTVQATGAHKRRLTLSLLGRGSTAPEAPSIHPRTSVAYPGCQQRATLGYPHLKGARWCGQCSGLVGPLASAANC